MKDVVDLAAPAPTELRGTGAGGGLALGTAMARGGVALACGDGVSGGLGDLFLCGVGDFSGAAFFFFFPLAGASFVGDFFGFGCGVASGVSLGLGETVFVGDFLALASGVSLGVGGFSDSAAFFFLALGFGVAEAVGDFFFFFGEALGVGDFSSLVEFAERALRIGLPSSVVSCA